MSLIEKAFKKAELFGNGKVIQLCPPSTIKQNKLNIKKSMKIKTIALISLSFLLLLLLCGSLIIYQKLNTNPSIKPDLDTAITSKPKVVANVLPSDISGQELTEKKPSTHLNEGKEIPALVKIENEIKSHDPKPIEKKESKPPSQKQLLNTHYNNAIKLEKEGGLREAVLEYERALVLNPNHIKSYNNLGGIYYKLDKFNLAVESYKKALAINPNYVKAHNNLGIVLFKLDEIDEAIDEFKLAISLDPKNTESYNNLGIIYKNIGEIEKAREALKSALAIGLENPEVHYNLALLYESEDNLESAFTHFQKFIELSSPHHHELKKKVREHLFVLAKKSALRETKQSSNSKKK